MARPVFAPWAVFALALLLAPSPAPAQDLELATDPHIRHEFIRLKTYERDRKWWPLIRGLDRLLVKNESTLVRQGRRFVSVRSRARAWLLELSRVPEARRVYDFAHGDSARCLLEAGARGTSLEPLEELIACYPASAHAPLALELLVSRRIERGRARLGPCPPRSAVRPSPRSDRGPPAPRSPARALGRPRGELATFPRNAGHRTACLAAEGVRVLRSRPRPVPSSQFAALRRPRALCPRRQPRPGTRPAHPAGCSGGLRFTPRTPSFPPGGPVTSRSRPTPWCACCPARRA